MASPPARALHLLPGSIGGLFLILNRPSTAMIAPLESTSLIAVITSRYWAVAASMPYVACALCRLCLYHGPPWFVIISSYSTYLSALHQFSSKKDRAHLFSQKIQQSLRETSGSQPTKICAYWEVNNSWVLKIACANIGSPLHRTRSGPAGPRLSACNWYSAVDAGSQPSLTCTLVLELRRSRASMPCFLHRPLSDTGNQSIAPEVYR